MLTTIFVGRGPHRWAESSGVPDPRGDLRDSGSIADQLHHLLAAAGISGAMVLMGHSIAGLHMRAYLSKYPPGIIGVVFVDAVTPEVIPQVREGLDPFMRQLVWIKPLMTLGSDVSPVDADPNRLRAWKRIRTGIGPTTTAALATPPRGSARWKGLSHRPARSCIPARSLIRRF